MTKKDYIKFADMLKNNKDYFNSKKDFYFFVDKMIVLFSEDNKQFDLNRFIDYINK